MKCVYKLVFLCEADASCVYGKLHLVIAMEMRLTAVNTLSTSFISPLNIKLFTTEFVSVLSNIQSRKTESPEMQ